MTEATAHSQASLQSADCYQPDGRVHLVAAVPTMTALAIVTALNAA